MGQKNKSVVSEICYTSTDGYPICYGCVHFKKYNNCYLNDTGSSLYPTSCKYFAIKKIKECEK